MYSVKDEIFAVHLLISKTSTAFYKRSGPKSPWCFNHMCIPWSWVKTQYQMLWTTVKCFA